MKGENNLPYSHICFILRQVFRKRYSLLQQDLRNVLQVGTAHLSF